MFNTIAGTLVLIQAIDHRIDPLAITISMNCANIYQSALTAFHLYAGLDDVRQRCGEYKKCTTIVRVQREGKVVLWSFKKKWGAKRAPHFFVVNLERVLAESVKNYFHGIG